MIGPPSGTRIWLVAGYTDLRKGVDGLCALVQSHFNESAFTGEVYLFRGKSGNKIKVLWATAEGMSFLYKRLNDAKFVWPQVRDGKVCLSAAQLSMLLEGIDWRHPKRTGLSPEDPDRTRPTRA
jgi:transposase